MLWYLSYFTIWESGTKIALCEPLVRGEILAGLGFSEGKLMDSLEVMQQLQGKQKQVGL